MYNKVNINDICKNKAKRLLGLEVIASRERSWGVVNCRYEKVKSARQQGRNR